MTQAQCAMLRKLLDRVSPPQIDQISYLRHTEYEYLTFAYVSKSGKYLKRVILDRDGRIDRRLSNVSKLRHREVR